MLLRNPQPGEQPLFRNIQPGAVTPRQPSTTGETVRSSDSDKHYLDTLDQLIADLVARKVSNFADLSRSCAGAWPSLVADRLRKLKLSSPVTTQSVSSPLPSYSPELHCGFGEWYFSSTSAEELAEEFISKRTFSLLLGTPTIARRAFARDANFTLVDSNPFVGLRFPELKKYLHHSSVEQLRGTFPRPSTIFLDAPWYLPTISFWLAKASQLTCKHTTIVMPLFQALTRPAAAQERSTILGLAERIGRVELVCDCIAYDSPLYEWEALVSSNVSAHPNWRRADLLIIRNPSPIPLPEVYQTDLQAIWETFLIGSQVVRLRLHPMPRRRQFLIAPLRGTKDYILDSVSARDDRRRLIGLWTSRNRVATVGDVRRMHYLFSILANSCDSTPPDIPTTIRPMLPPSDADALCRLLSSSTFH